MKLRFNLEYHTSYGDELVINVINKESNICQSFKMITLNGFNWSIELNDSMIPEEDFEYYYTVNKENRILRSEWMLQPHKFDFVSSAIADYTLYDHWIDIPEDAYLYSSAFTACLSRRSRCKCNTLKSSKIIELKVRAPQLRSTEHLFMVGDVQCLGHWQPCNAVAMCEHTSNEWVAFLNVEDISAVNFSFKFVAIDNTDHSILSWEIGDNRMITLPPMAAGEVMVYELSSAYFNRAYWRGAGTVIPVFSLRSRGSFGIGDFGDLKKMIDWMVYTNQSVLQILPINDTCITHTWTDSYPYNGISIYALHPQYIDLRQLPLLKSKVRRTYYEKKRLELNALAQVDYERVNNTKMQYLHELFDEQGIDTIRTTDFNIFFEDNKHWLVPYAVFCTYRDLYGTATFNEWPTHKTFTKNDLDAFSDQKSERYRQVAFWYFIQFNLDKQMRSVHEYACQHHIVLKGDIPIGISRDGVEAWVEPKYFNLDGQAGAPPDAFSVNGQNWGFPTYNWEEMLKDGCSWWIRRFRKMAEYFDAYRIDHVLGFFRIWEIPIHAVHGLLGQFSPSLAMSREEIESYGLHFQEQLFTEPFIADWTLTRIFGNRADEVKSVYLDHAHDDIWRMKPQFDTQRKIETYFKDKSDDSLRDGLYSLISDVLFIRDRKDKNKFHPRIGVQNDFIYEALYDHDKYIFNKLYNDYYYHRTNDFWYTEAMKKLPKLTQATHMLVCAEDLGMVPECVPWVMKELRILSLEIQSMPKDDGVRFGNLATNPYRSVCTISTHDMLTLRQWWDEDCSRAQDYFHSILHRSGAAPHPLPGWLAKDIISSHLACPSMLCLLSLQDWMAIDEHIRIEDADAERINIPANPRHYWRYRMHLSIEDLLEAKDFNTTIKSLIAKNERI